MKRELDRVAEALKSEMDKDEEHRDEND
jgi:hypothetical protein